MNGVHDMGGLQDMGPVQREEEEPVFHAAWEGRIYGISSSLRAMGKWNLDTWRHQIELLPPVDYLRMTYYERWLKINEQLLGTRNRHARSRLGESGPGLDRCRCSSPSWSPYSFES
jgi:nitrile hydratase